ncbi:heterocyst development glycosyltransferase HepC [Pseudanabaena mucicola]|uniref:Sugar transferase n=1 Tax=Pseudanabaena mucicola FACHB-723 TaxID=2692860 RepID=A0ABR7ZSU5_9CYAN|nr:heterocyst development glycosyltransferase HepC [Pseudanabaena mucicola]MBD2186530.1 sugar transferase [Pseudanabaena mucicola FACHB-723]
MTGLIVNKLSKDALINLPKRSILTNASNYLYKCRLLVNSLLDKSLIGLESVKNSLDQSLDNFADKNMILVEPEIGELKLKNLADVCQRSNKSVFLNLPEASELPQHNRAISWSIKRITDWLAALIILIILSPIMLILAAIIGGTSQGDIFFYQWRVGENGKLFRIIKFRTMITDADKLHHLVMTGQTGLHKCEDDPRITNVGKWMRKYSLDELPQLFNVLRGEMSLVGPRPWALYDALRISGDGKRRLKSLPGVTGAWQVSARSTMLDLDAVTECDLSYLRSWSLWSDLKILLMTVPKVLSGFGAC